MPKMTLLEMTQDIISEGDGDYINSITDSDESEQIAQIIKTAYWSLIEEKSSKWEHLKQLTVLDSSGDVNKPTHMKLGASVYRVHFLKYNKRKTGDTRAKFQEVEYCTPEEFLELTNARDDSQTQHTEITDYSGVVFTARNNKAPEWYTSFDDEYFVFDSWDNSLESTLQSAKTQVYVSSIPTWTTLDTFTPDLPAQAFSLLLSESKSVYWNSLKQLPNAKEEQRIQNHRRSMDNSSHRINRGEPAKRYGRTPKK